MWKTLAELCKKHGCELQSDIPLSQYTTFKIGGNADYLVEVTSVEGLQGILSFLKKESVPYFILGRGSNVLVCDKGFRGVILHIGSALAEYSLDGTTLTALAGTSLSTLARFAESHSLSGLECLCGIPGTVGGALYMNAGAYGTEMRDIVRSCTYLDEAAMVQTLSLEEMELSYRHSIFSQRSWVILSVTMELQQGKQEEIHEKAQALLGQRKEKQPLEYPSAGSTFKRPEGSYASLLIDQCGLRGERVGDAQISEKHCGFVINRGKASFADVMALCEQVKAVVEKKTGYHLELEPEILGE